MDILDTLNISGSGLSAQRVRLRTIASNLANARTTRTEDGGPYRRKAPALSAESLSRFGDTLDRTLASVKIDSIEESTQTRLVHDPSHPDAGPDGYVQMPDVDMLAEMVDLMTASRSYEANLNALETTRDMALQALEIGR